MTQTAQPPEQLALFAALGVAELPVGMADLTAKETRFVLAYLRTGLASTAAREAGYSDPEADAAKIRRRPAVARILNASATSAASNAAGLARRVWERSQAFHDELQQIRPKIAALRAEGLPTPSGEEDKCRTEYIMRLAFLEQRERFLVDSATKQDQLLATLHSKIELNISGTIDHAHTHVVLTGQKMAELVAARREALAYRGD